MLFYLRIILKFSSHQYIFEWLLSEKLPLAVLIPGNWKRPSFAEAGSATESSMINSALTIFTTVLNWYMNDRWKFL
jgi:hypothetical protein